VMQLQSLPCSRGSGIYFRKHSMMVIVILKLIAKIFIKQESRCNGNGFLL
jgi:hypothetical protein